MSDLLAARSQMAVSLAFHIVFAVIGIAMPLMMVLAERRWQVTGHEIYLDLAKRWAKGTAILFAVGAVSGTVLSFELGLLWPRSEEHTSELQSRLHLVCRLLLEKKKVQHSERGMRGAYRSRVALP